MKAEVAGMGIDAETVTLLTTELASPSVRELFTTIAGRRIAEAAPLREANPEAAQGLEVLTGADLIGMGSDGARYYVTAKGLKVARDLQKLNLR